MLPVTEQEIDAFLAEFEAGRLPKAQWTHGAHLLTGASVITSEISRMEFWATLRLRRLGLCPCSPEFGAWMPPADVRE